MAEKPVQLECAWCGVVLAAGALPPSHGICDRCYGISVATLEAALREAESAGRPGHAFSRT